MRISVLIKETKPRRWWECDSLVPNGSGFSFEFERAPKGICVFRQPSVMLAVAHLWAHAPRWARDRLMAAEVLLLLGLCDCDREAGDLYWRWPFRPFRATKNRAWPGFWPTLRKLWR